MNWSYNPAHRERLAITQICLEDVHIRADKRHEMHGGLLASNNSNDCVFRHRSLDDVSPRVCKSQSVAYKLTNELEPNAARSPDYNPRWHVAEVKPADGRITSRQTRYMYARGSSARVKRSSVTGPANRATQTRTKRHSRPSDGLKLLEIVIPALTAMVHT